MPNIFTSPQYLDIILGVFALQESGESYTTTITQVTQSPPSSEDITKTSEYNRVIRAVKILEKLGIIQKVKPQGKESSKTYYKIELETLTEHIVSYLKDLPTYGYTLELDDADIKDWKNNKLVRSFLGIYYRLLSVDFLLFKKQDKKGILNLDMFTLRDSLFTLIDKVVTKQFPSKGTDDTPKSFSDIPKIKDKEKRRFMEFLSVLWALGSQYLPYAYINGFNHELSDFIGAAMGEKGRFNAKVYDVLDDESKIFQFHKIN